jgi:hypothetical protein
MILLRCLLLYLALVAMGLAEDNQTVQAVGGLVFDSDYENGSLGAVDALGPDAFECALHTEVGGLGERRYWFRFKLRGIEKRKLTLMLDHEENPRPFLRVDGQPWRRLTAREAPSLDRMILKFGDGDTEAELAFFEPLGLGETEAIVNGLIQNAGAFAWREWIGASEEGRPLELVTVTNPTVADTGKRRVWIHSRAHAGEVTSTHSVLGVLEQCLTDSAVGRLLRDKLIVYVLPVLNVDGVAKGYTRWDAVGRDPESQWCAIDSPSVRAVKARVDTLMANAQPIELSLNLHSTH